MSMPEPSVLADALRATVFLVHHIPSMDDDWVIGVGLNLTAAMRMADEGAVAHCGGWQEQLTWGRETNCDPLDEEITDVKNGRPKTVITRLAQSGCAFEIHEWPIRP